MIQLARLVVAVFTLTGFGSAALAEGVTLDPAVIAFTLPDQIAWVDNPRAGNRTAVLQGSRQARPLRGAAAMAAGPYEPPALPSQRPPFHCRFWYVVGWIGS